MSSTKILNVNVGDKFTFNGATQTCLVLEMEDPGTQIRGGETIEVVPVLVESDIFSGWLFLDTDTDVIIVD